MNTNGVGSIHEADDDAIEADIWKNWIMWQVVSECGSLKIDNGGDTGMSFDAIY